MFEGGTSGTEKGDISNGGGGNQETVIVLAMAVEILVQQKWEQ